MGKRLAVGTAVVVVLALVVAAALWWRARPESDLARATALAPADAERLTWTDWAGVRGEVGSDVDAESSASDVSAFLDEAYAEDLTATSALGESAVVMHERYGFSPASLEWELFSQSSRGAVLLMRLPDEVDPDGLRETFEGLGYQPPDEDDGVWAGGSELLPRIAPDLTPELQFLAVSDDEDLVLASDTADYLRDVVRGLGEGVPADLRPVLDVAGEAPLTAVAYDGTYTCTELAMSQADAADQEAADDLLAQAGEINPLTAFLMAEQPGGRIRLAMGFESEQQARTNADSRAALLAGPAPGQGGDFTDRFELGDVVANGTVVRTDLTPGDGEYVVSDLTAGPVLFASC